MPNADFTSLENGAARWTTYDLQLNRPENLCVSSGWVIFWVCMQKLSTLESVNTIRRSVTPMYNNLPLNVQGDQSAQQSLSNRWFSALQEFVEETATESAVSDARALRASFAKPMGDWTHQDKLNLTQLLIWIAFYSDQRYGTTNEFWKIDQVALLPDTIPFSWNQPIQFPAGDWRQILDQATSGQLVACYPANTSLRLIGEEPNAGLPTPIADPEQRLADVRLVGMKAAQPKPNQLAVGGLAVGALVLAWKLMSK